MQLLLVVVLILVHDALILLAGFAIATNALTLNLEGGLLVKKSSVQMVPSGGDVTVGSGELLSRCVSKDCDTHTPSPRNLCTTAHMHSWCSYKSLMHIR